MACLQIYREWLSLATFLRLHSNSKEASYLSWQNTYPYLKITCHIKLKFFLWTKLIEKLLLAKYLISVTTPLSFFPANIYLFKVNNWNNRKRCEILKLTIKTPEQRYWSCSGVFIVNWSYFTPFSSVSTVNFEQVNVSWVWTLEVNQVKYKFSKGLNCNIFFSTY